MSFRLILTRLCGSMIRPRLKALPTKTLFPQQITARCHGLIPKDQYDHPWTKKMRFPQVLSTYWETIPLFVTTGASIALVFAIFIWNAFHKVDVVFKTHSRNNISRTMDLRFPTKHKLIIMNNFMYRPWPQMQDVLEKMKNEECKREARKKASSKV